MQTVASEWDELVSSLALCDECDRNLETYRAAAQGTGFEPLMDALLMQYQLQARAAERRLQRYLWPGLV